MRKFSLVLAAAVMAVGLAVSGGASAEDMPSNYEVLANGDILMKSATIGAHFFTVHYDGVIYSCMLNNGNVGCNASLSQTNKATALHLS
ncbi:MAG: hypothetical protein QF449_03445 [Alphaproteobacteria bacterium]|jgi:hypothetical protein|nr:hypothetical protein [Alphaproteobacteria bacterium]|tara:strand:- start:18 stop:284 length:267 start_codon:yes stop_codon:yes gene_type:complete